MKCRVGILPHPGSKRVLRREESVADLRQVVFSQTGHFHDGIAVNAVLQHGAVNFQSGLTLTF